MYKKLIAPRLRWLKTATGSFGNQTKKRKGPLDSPDIPLPDPCAVQPRATSPATTSHRMRLLLPKEFREQSVSSRRETASFHRLFCPGSQRWYRCFQALLVHSVSRMSRNIKKNQINMSGSSASFSAHALHENSLQTKIGNGTVVSIQERRALAVPLINCLSTTGKPLVHRGFCSPIRLHSRTCFA